MLGHKYQINMLLTVVKVKMVHGNLTGHKTVHIFVVVVAIVESYCGIQKQIGQNLIFLFPNPEVFWLPTSRVSVAFSSLCREFVNKF